MKENVTGLMLGNPLNFADPNLSHFHEYDNPNNPQHTYSDTYLGTNWYTGQTIIAEYIITQRSYRIHFITFTKAEQIKMKI